METRSKKVKFIEKVISKAEYDKMCKVRVLLQRFNADAFRKTGEFFPANKKVTNNVHIVLPPKLGTSKKVSKKITKTSLIANDTKDNGCITRAQKRKHDEISIIDKSAKADDKIDETAQAPKHGTSQSVAKKNTKTLIANDTDDNGRITRAQKRKHDEMQSIDKSAKADDKIDKGTKAQKRNKTRKKNELLLKEKIANEAPSNSYLLHEIVLATIPGFVPWPARIKNIIGETIYVEFFGTGQVNPIRTKAMMRFDINTVIPLLQRRGYRKAIKEVELSLGIPTSESVLSE